MSRRAAANLFVLDLSRYADAAQRGHEHQVSAGNADVRRQRGALGADAFLDHLHQQFVAAAKNVLDGRFESRPAAGKELFASGGIAGFFVFIVEFGGIGPGVSAVAATAAARDYRRDRRVFPDRNRPGGSIAARCR